MTTQSYPPPAFPFLLRRALFVLVFAFVLLIPFSAHAQTTAILSGRVTNAKGEPLPNTAVSLHKSRSGPGSRWHMSYYSTRTNENGEYAFLQLEPGTYRMLIGIISSAEDGYIPGIPSPYNRYLGEYYYNWPHCQALRQVSCS
jgi:hypothetical protein